MRGITRDTIVELVDRKMLWMFGILTALACLIVFGASKADMTFSMHGPSGLENDLAQPLISSIAIRAAYNLLTFLVFLAVVATAGIIPKFLEKGRADFYLSKPISRQNILLGKLGAMWLVYGTVILLCGMITYLFAALAFDQLDFRILYVFGFSLASYFVWLSITGLAGVWTGSTAISVMCAFVVWVLQSILQHYDTIGDLINSEWISRIVQGLYYVIPKTSQMADLGMNLARGKTGPELLPLWSSLLFAATMYALAVVVFKRKNY